MLEFAKVSVGDGGGVKCTLCSPPEPPVFRPVEEIVADVERLAGAAGTTGLGPNVELSGPEPFSHPHFLDVVRSCVRAGVARLRVDTDGAYLAEEEHAATVLEAGVLHVRVTLLGGEAASHDRLIGRPGAFEAARGGMATYLEAMKGASSRAMLSGYVPVGRHNYEELTELVGAFVTAGARYVALRIVDPELSASVAAPWLAAAYDTGVMNSTWVCAEAIPGASLPGYELHAGCDLCVDGALQQSGTPSGEPPQ